LKRKWVLESGTEKGGKNGRETGGRKLFKKIENRKM
jgi:hypothetical protein